MPALSVYPLFCGLLNSYHLLCHNKKKSTPSTRLQQTLSCKKLPQKKLALARAAQAMGGKKLAGAAPQAPDFLFLETGAAGLGLGGGNRTF